MWLVMSVFLLLTSCTEGYEIPSGICDVDAEYSVDKELGRIYYFNDSTVPERRFYYIGNPDKKYKGGGYVPCNGLPEDFIPEGEIGTLVIYSGRVKTRYSLDTEEPYYYGLDLIFIKKHEEETANQD